MGSAVERANVDGRRERADLSASGHNAEAFAEWHRAGDPRRRAIVAKGVSIECHRVRGDDRWRCAWAW
jgi:hypothetical protein